MPQQIKRTLLCTMMVLAAGCSTHKTPTDPMQAPAYEAALEKQNQAVRSVSVYKTIPTDALGVQPVMAASCGTGPKMTGADENYILTGLKLKAFKYGANAIAEVDIQEIPGQEGHCQGSAGIGGTAKAFTVRQ